jgi:hypothetical protein
MGNGGSACGVKCVWCVLIRKIGTYLGITVVILGNWRADFCSVCG